MTETPEESHGFWSRLSGRGKTLIIVDLAVLVVLIGVGAAYVAMFRSESPHASPSSSATSDPPPQPAPFQTTYGLAWIVAACGGAMVLDDLPESPLPRANDSAVCVAPEGAAATAIGVYPEQTSLDDDVADVRRAHRYATRIDESGNHWLVLVEGESAAPLAPLAQYGFQLR